jgi:uncharacterized protein (UPF0332 family)
MSVPDPDHLLDQADRLIASTGGGAARQVDLRRAISNAYYALFHAVTAEVVDDFVGSSYRQTPRYSLVYRSVKHRALQELCEDIAKPTLPRRYSRFAPEGGFGADLKLFATTLVALQNHRHLADYDPLFRATRSNAADIVKRGREALARFRRADEKLRKDFLALVAFPPRQTHQEPEA